MRAAEKFKCDRGSASHLLQRGAHLASYVSVNPTEKKKEREICFYLLLSGSLNESESRRCTHEVRLFPHLRPADSRDIRRRACTHGR